MKPALLLVDLQRDYLDDASLEPARGEVVARAADLLAAARRAGVPVVHAWTTVRRDGPDRRMPHWRRAGRWMCVEGTRGHETPEALRPRGGEPVVHKTFYSAFEGPDLADRLRSLGVDTVVLAGLHLHACLRATAIDAYRLGFDVWIADDAVAGYDETHGAQTRRYLAERVVRFLSNDEIVRAWAGTAGPTARRPDAPALPGAIIGGERRDSVGDPGAERVHRCPADRERALWRVPRAGAELVGEAASMARQAGEAWRRSDLDARADRLDAFIGRLLAERDAIAGGLAEEVGKPITDARLEIDFCVGLVRAAIGHARAAPLDREIDGAVVRRRPLGVVGLITPWNNPLAIPMGKIAPALLYGNGVVWKPAIPGTGVALRVMELLAASDLPAGLVNLVCGDRATAGLVMADPSVDAVSITGSSGAGAAAQAVCAGRRIPLQAELGGNNAAIVWSDCDLERAAHEIAAGAFGCAGQRCTANRRVVADARCYDGLRAALVDGAASIAWGDPLEERCRVGPVISEGARWRIEGVIERARAEGAEVISPQSETPKARELRDRGAYVAPTVVCCDEPAHEVVQHETFGPVLVLQRAEDWEQALRLCNGVRQGLVAALFSPDAGRRAEFLERAEAGILKLDTSTAGAGVEAPFGGWKRSGVGPAEHGEGDREFYTRAQAVYR